MGKDSSDIIRYFFFKNTPNIIQMLFPLCEVVLIYSGIVQMCTPCPGTLNRRASTISTPLYTFSLSIQYYIVSITPFLFPIGWIDMMTSQLAEYWLSIGQEDAV